MRLSHWGLVGRLAKENPAHGLHTGLSVKLDHDVLQHILQLTHSSLLMWTSSFVEMEKRKKRQESGDSLTSSPGYGSESMLPHHRGGAEQVQDILRQPWPCLLWYLCKEAYLLTVIWLCLVYKKCLNRYKTEAEKDGSYFSCRSESSNYNQGELHHFSIKKSLMPFKLTYTTEVTILRSLSSFNAS